MHKLSSNHASVCGYQHYVSRAASPGGPIAASFTRQVTERKTESVTAEIRWKKEREREEKTAGPVSDCDSLAICRCKGDIERWQPRTGLVLRANSLTEAVPGCQDNTVQYFSLQRQRATERQWAKVESGWEITPMQGSRPNTNEILNTLFFFFLSNNADLNVCSKSSWCKKTPAGLVDLMFGLCEDDDTVHFRPEQRLPMSVEHIYCITDRVSGTLEAKTKAMNFHLKEHPFSEGARLTVNCKHCVSRCIRKSQFVSP